MTEYRLAKPEEWEDCIEFANYVFSTAHRPHDFEQLIPRVYQAGPEMARIHRVAVAENGRIRAEIAVLPQKMAAGGKLLRVGYVGSVSVHPKARGEGHMKRLLSDWIRELEGTCDFLALDGQRQRYAYFGFAPGSEKYTFCLDEANVRHTWKQDELSAYTFAPLFPKNENGETDQEAVSFAQKLNEAKPLYIVRDDVEASLKTFGEEAVAVWKNGERIGYLAVCGENGIAEAEFVENADYVPALAAYLKEKKAGSLFISVPVYETKKAAALAELCESFAKERCGSAMYRIFDFANAVEAFLQLKADQMGISNGTWSAVMEGQPLTIQVQNNTVTVTREAHPGAAVLTREEAQELLLSPLTRVGSRIPQEIWKDIPSDWFPLPLYCFMADEF